MAVRVPDVDGATDIVTERLARRTQQRRARNARSTAVPCASSPTAPEERDAVSETRQSGGDVGFCPNDRSREILRER